jgi:hypothetical protein
MLVTFFVSANPVQLVLVYGVLGALFMPFLAATLLWLLNWRVDRQHRNGWASNVMLIVLSCCLEHSASRIYCISGSSCQRLGVSQTPRAYQGAAEKMKGVSMVLHAFAASKNRPWHEMRTALNFVAIAAQVSFLSLCYSVWLTMPSRRFMHHAAPAECTPCCSCPW